MIRKNINAKPDFTILDTSVTILSFKSDDRYYDNTKICDITYFNNHALYKNINNPDGFNQASFMIDFYHIKSNEAMKINNTIKNVKLNAYHNNGAHNILGPAIYSMDINISYSVAVSIFIKSSSEKDIIKKFSKFLVNTEDKFYRKEFYVNNQNISEESYLEKYKILQYYI